MTAMHLGRLLATDMHVHVGKDARDRYALDHELSSAAAKYFKGEPLRLGPEHGDA